MKQNYDEILQPSRCFCYKIILVKNMPFVLGWHLGFSFLLGYKRIQFKCLWTRCFCIELFLDSIMFGTWLDSFGFFWRLYIWILLFFYVWNVFFGQRISAAFSWWKTHKFPLFQWQVAEWCVLCYFPFLWFRVWTKFSWTPPAFYHFEHLWNGKRSFNPLLFCSFPFFLKHLSLFFITF